MRGRLIFPFAGEFVRLDRTAMAEGSDAVDPDFREPRLAASEPDDVGTLARRELPPVRVPCQVEDEAFERLRMTGAGNDPETRLQLVIHFLDLERRGLVDVSSGRALLVPGDRLMGLYDATGALVQAVDLYVTETRPIGFGFGLLRPRRNLLLLVLEGRTAAARTAP
jgi:hypothetical protein